MSASSPLTFAPLGGPTPDIVVDAVSWSIPGTLRPVLTDVAFRVGATGRVALIGENGSGKSSLLRVVVGELVPDHGDALRPTAGFLPQEVTTLPWARVEDVWAAALAPARRAIEELEAAAMGLAGGGERDGQDEPSGNKTAARYEDALAAAEALDAWNADAALARAMAGLGLGPLAPDRELVTLSGGQLRRLALGALLVQRPAALVLDEPTNHLDDAASDFLATALAAWPGPVLFASHDRDFVDGVATALVDLDPPPQARGEQPIPAELLAGRPAGAGATWFGGTLSQYLEQKRVTRAAWEARYEAEQDELGRLRTAGRATARSVAHNRSARDNDKFIVKFKGARTEAEVSKRVRDTEQRIDVLQRNQVPRPPRLLQFALPAGSGRQCGAGRSASAAGSGGRGQTPPTASLCWATEVRLPGISGPRLDMPASEVRQVTVAAGDRVLITGPNGAGKSTLLALLAGDLTVAEAGGTGDAGQRPGARIGLLEQETALVGDQRTARALLGLAGGGVGGVGGAGGAGRRDSPAIETFGLIAPRDLDRPVAELSVGQQRRVLLAMLLHQQPDVLLLDEPTNHLSIPLVAELFEGLAQWPGALVVASHDRWLRRTWQGSEVALGLGSRPGGQD